MNYSFIFSRYATEPRTNKALEKTTNGSMEIGKWCGVKFECQSIGEKDDFKRKMTDVPTLTLRFAHFREANPPKGFTRVC